MSVEGCEVWTSHGELEESDSGQDLDGSAARLPPRLLLAARERGAAS